MHAIEREANARGSRTWRRSWLVLVGIAVIGGSMVASSSVGLLGQATPTHVAIGNSPSPARTFSGLTAGIEYTAFNYPATSGSWGSVSWSGLETGGSGSYTCSWTFGDGGTSTSCSPTHSWTSAGTYTLSLTVTNGGSHASTSTTINTNAGNIHPIGNPSLIIWYWGMIIPCPPHIWCGPTPAPNPFTSTGIMVTSGSITYSTNFGDGSGWWNGETVTSGTINPGTYSATFRGTIGSDNFDGPVTIIN